jgi:hypothetical protein
LKQISLLIAMTGLTQAQPAVASAAPCDHACLNNLAENFADAAMRGKLRGLTVSPDVEIRENGAITTLAASAWPQVRSIRSRMVLADPLTGNVILRAGVEMKDGKPAYISMRLKRAASGRITDIEIASDMPERVLPAYVWNLDPLYTQILPEDQRTGRAAMEAIVRRYFHTLDTHEPIKADIDDEACDRFHSGTKITHVASNSVEGGGMRTCVSANEGARPWGPASEQRVPVIDVERGVAVGITLLHYPRLPGQPTMYVTEVFKIVKGRITRIDNIGLMQQSMESLGYVH